MKTAVITMALPNRRDAESVIPPSGDRTDPGPKPKQNADGSYDCMLESFKRKQVTEPQMANRVLQWGKPVLEVWKGWAYWAILFEYETSTVFGKPETQVRALVRNNIVHLWLYVGSNEIVP